MNTTYRLALSLFVSIGLPACGSGSDGTSPPTNDASPAAPAVDGSAPLARADDGAPGTVGDTGAPGTVGDTGAPGTGSDGGPEPPDRICADDGSCPDTGAPDAASEAGRDPSKTYCSEDDPCGDDGYCIKTPGRSGGRCATRYAAGATCSSESIDPDLSYCVTGTYCAFPRVSTGDGTCTKAHAAGEPCELSTYAGGLRRECADGTTCVRGDGGQGTCAPVKSVGDACVQTTDCARGLYCASGRCAARKAPGDACTDKSLTSTECKAGSQCVNGVCIP